MKQRTDKEIRERREKKKEKQTDKDRDRGGETVKTQKNRERKRDRVGGGCLEEGVGMGGEVAWRRGWGWVGRLPGGGGGDGWGGCLEEGVGDGWGGCLSTHPKE